MNPRTRKIIDNHIWEYLEQLGMDASNRFNENICPEKAYLKLHRIAQIATEIRIEVDLR
jgi:hypothetical protein